MNRHLEEIVDLYLPSDWLAVQVDVAVPFGDFWPFLVECMAKEVWIRKLVVIPVEGQVEEHPLFIYMSMQIMMPWVHWDSPTGPYPVWTIKDDRGAALHVLELVGGDLRVESYLPEELIASVPLEDLGTISLRCDDQVPWEATASAMRAMVGRGLWLGCPLPTWVDTPMDASDVWSRLYR